MGLWAFAYLPICWLALLRIEKIAAAITELHPLKQLGKSEDIASLAAYLLSEQADWITGQIISVDGGRSTPAAQHLKRVQYIF